MPTETGTQFAAFPPSTFDRADGLDGRPGTPTPPEALIKIPIHTFFEEMSTSPEIERAEQGTVTKQFRCDTETAYAIISTIGRGYTLEDSFGNTSRVVNARMQWQKGDFAIITIVAETLSWDWPIDEFSLEVTELNPALEKHPRYNLLTYQDRINVHVAIQSEGIEFQGMYQGIIDTIPQTPSITIQGITSTPREQAQELAFKLHKGEDSFYLPGFRITYSQYFSIPVPLNPGGYIQDPVTSGALPWYFWSTANNTDPNTSMFLNLAAVNPTIYNNGISWLRLCDTSVYQRTWFRLSSTWQGAPLGHWDKEIYTIPFQPYQTKETEGTVIRP